MDNLPTLLPSTQELDVYLTMAKRASDSKYYQSLGGEAGIAAIMLYARELGVSPMQAISGGFHNIQGKLEMSARLMNMMIRRGGHFMQITHPDPDTCQIYGKRKDTGEEYTATYTYEEAKKAGIAKPGGGWDKHRQDMLFARAISRLARRLFPDVIGTSYVEGEISEGQNKSPVSRAKLEIIDIKPGDPIKHKEVTETVGLPEKTEDQDIIDHDAVVTAVVEQFNGEVVEPKPKKKTKQRSSQESYDAFVKYCVDKQKMNSLLVKEAMEEMLVTEWGTTDTASVPEALWADFELWLKDVCLDAVKRRIEEYDELGGRE